MTKGPKPKPSDQRQEKYIRVRMTLAQKKIIDAAAARQGFGASTWLRALGLREAAKEIDR